MLFLGDPVENQKLAVLDSYLKLEQEKRSKHEQKPKQKDEIPELGRKKDNLHLHNEL